MCSCTHTNVSCSTLHSSLYVLMSHAGWKGTLRALGLIPSPIPDATLQSVGYMPVSYTHLTLPTIYSV